MPRRKGGLWLPLDVNFMEDDRIVAVGEKPAWLYLAMCLASKRLGTDGLLTARQVDRLHVSSWRARLTPLVNVELVADFGEDLWGIHAWLRHNDPQVKVEEIRAKDRDRKKNSPPSGIRTESVPSRDVEKSREEKREVGRRPELHGPCPGCVDCPTPLRIVGDTA